MKNIKYLKYTSIILLSIVLSLSLVKVVLKSHDPINMAANKAAPRPKSPPAPVDEPIKKTKKILLDVPLIAQLPELYNGCEITSLTMLLNYKGVDVDKLTLANNMTKDPTPLMRDESGDICSWGNPDVGFVGDVEGDQIPGFAINPKPLIPLINQYYSNGAIDLTGSTLDDINKSLENKNPVVVWVTADLGSPYDFNTWIDSRGNEVLATFQTHAVLLTGYDEENYYYNDPLNELKGATVSKDIFDKVWTEMGKKALSVN